MAANISKVTWPQLCNLIRTRGRGQTRSSGRLGGKRLLSKGHKSSDNFKADKTGLFFQTMPNRSLVKKGSNDKSGKLAKERVTILLAA